MTLRIKELLQEQGLRMKDIADRLGMDQSNLAKSLSKNPTLSTLQEVAKALNVDVQELFVRATPKQPTGIAVIGGKTYGLAEMPSVFQLPSYTDYSQLRKDIKAFIQKSIKEEQPDAFGAYVSTFELISLAYDKGNASFLLTLYYGNKKSATFTYDKFEYADWKEGNAEEPIWNLDDMMDEMIGVIENYVPALLG